MKKDDLISGSKWHMQKSIGRINSVKGENQCKGTEKYISLEINKQRNPDRCDFSHSIVLLMFIIKNAFD